MICDIGCSTKRVQKVNLYHQHRTISGCTFTEQITSVSFRKKSHYTPIGHGWKLCNTGDIAPLLMTKDAAPSRPVELSSCRCQKSACLQKRFFAHVIWTDSPAQRPAHVWQMTTSFKTHIKISRTTQLMAMMTMMTKMKISRKFE